MYQTNLRTFAELLSDLLQLADEVASLAKDSETEPEIFTEFAVFVEKFSPILIDLRDNSTVMDTLPIQKAVESLENELRHAKTVIKASNSRTSAKKVEEIIHDLGRCLGLVLLASLDVSVDIKEKFGALHKEMMNVRVNASIDHELEFVHDLEVKGEDDGRTIFDINNIALHLKYGNDEEFRFALSGLRSLISEKMIQNEWVSDEGIIPILLNRLASSEENDRLTIISILKSFILDNDENKGKMVDVGSLAMLVRSLTRDVEERREAVGLLLALSEVPAVRRRLGRIQGCILMLVAVHNGYDPYCSHDAGKLLNVLSSNTQNALHMAEAGYFKPLIEYLREGSDMSKILMATALSRMELTDQSRAAFGEGGAIEPLVKMFSSEKLEAKLSALGALQNLSSSTENVQILINSGIVTSLLQLLFCVTSVLMTLREPASAILASIAQSESILVNQDVAQKMLPLLNLSSPVIQCNLLRALNSIASHSNASKVKFKMKENGALQLLLPFLTDRNTEIRTVALNFLYNLSKDSPGDLSELLEEIHLNVIVNIVSESVSEDEKAAAVGLLSNIPVGNKKVTDFLKKVNLLAILLSLLGVCTPTSTPTRRWLVESVAAILIRFTVPSDKKLQQLSAEHGVIAWLVKLLSIGSPTAKCRAATSLAQLSQNTLSLSKSRALRWRCMPPSGDGFCEVHEGYCFVKSTFCLVKAGALSPLFQILEGEDREADETVLGALSTIMQDEIWENGSKFIVKASGVHALLKVLELGNIKAQEKALWILERIFRIEDNKVQYGEPAQVLLIELAQNGSPTLKSMIAKILAHLELLQAQSSYF
ncbi:U-box domain-containing protein 44-like [Macadamia integrifolia]|uniref:U-box domain-containing protein 44-like n=1 Tax=Macadamia integrifolia TaxID=60698 RepID=UPI001C4EDD66|nr:U-box domain-containing protein 44-like [Macadamia integrifolia]XP_042491627.1 U-box domain-containing protein 44-like [Macadamia integrifolia]